MEDQDNLVEWEEGVVEEEEWEGVGVTIGGMGEVEMVVGTVVEEDEVVMVVVGTGVMEEEDMVVMVVVGPGVVEEEDVVVMVVVGSEVAEEEDVVVMVEEEVVVV
jgi:hypothetical protein